jgi:hypothetical protein
MEAIPKKFPPLDHPGVPRSLRPLLPIVNATAVGALVGTSNRPTLRPLVGAGLVPYYSAAVAFHLRAGDPPTEVAPAAACA